MASTSTTPRGAPPSRLTPLSMKELQAEAKKMGVQVEGIQLREDVLAKLEEAVEQANEAPSETVRDWLKPQMKGYLLKDAVQSRSNTKKRYFVVCGNFLMYYENEKESVFHPKGVWCLDDCRVGMMKRPGLGEKQACLLRGKRELVITADSLEELKAWNKAVQQARKYTPTRFADLEQRAQQDAAKLQRQIDSTIVELELTRSKLREERQHAARMHSDLAAAKEAGYKLEANVQEAERRQKELKLQMDAEFAARDEATRQVVEHEAARADSAVEALEAERRNRASSNAKRVARDDDAERLKVQIDELRSQLHREVEARQAADILKEAAIRSQLELQESVDKSREEMRGMVEASKEEARRAAEELARLQREAQHFEQDGLASDAEDAARRKATEEAITVARRRARSTLAETEDAEARLADEAEVAAMTRGQIVAELPREMRRCNGALRLLCARLKKIERPEAALLYADVMSSRAKLVHAIGQWADQ